jgi:hypothetical protein
MDKFKGKTARPSPIHQVPPMEYPGTESSTWGVREQTLAWLLFTCQH